MTTVVDALRSDFDALTEQFGRGDILWRDQAGDDVLWLMNGNTPDTVATLPFVAPDWHFKAATSFGSVPGDADILWQNDNGAVAIWGMNGTTVTTIHALPNPGPTWHVVGDNDFDGDHSDDILFRNDNGALAIWNQISLDTGGVGGPGVGMFAGTQNPGPSWHVVATGDPGNFGHAGILWQNDNGALALWGSADFSNNFPFVSTVTFLSIDALPSVDPSWHVKGMADFNRDGRSDIVFQHDSGAIVIWEMGRPFGTGIDAANLININPGPSWHVVGLRNMDGDNRADILFQNDNGSAALWENYQSLGGGSATFNTVLAIDPNPNPNGHVWDLL